MKAKHIKTLSAFLPLLALIFSACQSDVNGAASAKSAQAFPKLEMNSEAAQTPPKSRVKAMVMESDEVRTEQRKDPRNADFKRKAKLKDMLFIPRGEPKLDDENSFTFILYGDPQSYVKNMRFEHIFDMQTAWTAAFKDRLNIKAVLCTGDLVETNDYHIPNCGDSKLLGKFGDQDSSKQWAAVSKAFSRLDGVLPYIVCTGNHDYGYVSAENRNSEFHKYFYPEKNPSLRKTLVSTGKNYFGKMTLENAAYEFEDKNWGKILVLSMEFAPSDRSIDWAKKLVSQESYKNHKVIILTHAFLNRHGLIFHHEPYKLQDRNWGTALWEKFIFGAPNVKMLICGHSAGWSSYREEVNAFGKKVKMMMFNPQFDTGNGGDGWLRILEFKPDGKTIGVKTYSPLFGVSSETDNLAWMDDEKNQYEIELEN